MQSKGRGNGTYFIYDRLKDLESREELILSKYMTKYEISRSSAMRDIQHLRDFYGIEFIYDHKNHCYKRG